jgi:hypothetical protein
VESYKNMSKFKETVSIVTWVENVTVLKGQSVPKPDRWKLDSF